MDILIASMLAILACSALCAYYAARLPQKPLKIYFFVMSLLALMGGLAFAASADGIQYHSDVTHLNTTPDGLQYFENRTEYYTLPENSISSSLMIAIGWTFIGVFFLLAIAYFLDYVEIFKRLRRHI